MEFHSNPSGLYGKGIRRQRGMSSSCIRCTEFLERKHNKTNSLSTPISIFTLLYIQLLATFMKTFEYVGDDS